MARRPLDGVPPITQVYGVKNSIYRKGYHTGVDYGVGTGTAVKSPTNGVIVQVGDGRAASDGRGFFMIIRGDDGVTHHLYHLLRWHVGSGRVAEGQHLADSDNTGLSSGPHLHWETRRNNQDFNPADWLFAPVQPPITNPSQGSTSMIFENDAQIQAFYYVLRGKNATEPEVAGWRGKPMLQFVTNQYAIEEVRLREQRTAQLEGQVANLSGQIQNIQKQIDELNKRPTQAQLEDLMKIKDAAVQQSEIDRARAEELAKQLEEAQKHPAEQVVDEQQVVQNFLKRIWNNLFKKG